MFNINYIDSIEAKYLANSFNGIEGDAIRYIKGENQILLSAPHSVNQYRNSKLKMAERYTGAMAEIVQSITGCHMIAKAHNDYIDDNYVLHTKYKTLIGEIIKKENIKFVLDLHGMLSSLDTGFRGYHIEIGTNDRKNLLNRPEFRDIAIDIFNKYGVVSLKADYIFRASKPYTISNYIANNFNTPAMQLEVSSDYRNPNFNLRKFNIMIKSIAELLSIVNSYR